MHGHAGGDAALREAAELMIASLAIFTDADRVEELRQGPAGALDGAAPGGPAGAVGAGRSGADPQRPGRRRASTRSRSSRGRKA